MAILFTSESVSEGHPDKVADQISDALLDAFLAGDPRSRCAIETLCTTGLVVVSGEVTSETYVDVQEVVRQTIEEIGYTDPLLQFDARSCGVLVSIHEQSADIAQGVDDDRGLHAEQGAGDQGMMFGYATREDEDTLMPLALMLSHRLVKRLADLRKAGEVMPYLRPDAKSQVTIEYEADGRTPKRVHTVVISTQHEEIDPDDDDASLARIKADVREHVLPHVLPAELVDEDLILHVNPTGTFVIGGPHGDTGLTGRKIIVDTYGGKGAHGGGAFSGKDPSKVDRSAAYATRHVAKNLVAAGLADEALVQVAYAIGVADPVSIRVDTNGTAQHGLTDAQLAALVSEHVDLRPAAIIRRFGLIDPDYNQSLAFHAAQRKRTVQVQSGDGSNTKESPVALHKEGLTNVGTVLQGRLFRTLADIDTLETELGPAADYRICKGIYLEPEEISFTAYRDIVDATNAAIDRMLTAGAYVGVASHDQAVVDHTLSALQSHGMGPGVPDPRDNAGPLRHHKGPGYEFQMLLGVLGPLRRKLLRDGHRTRVYIPYGEKWYEYSIRRLQENPTIGTHVAKAFLMPWTNRP